MTDTERTCCKAFNCSWKSHVEDSILSKQTQCCTIIRHCSLHGTDIDPQVYLITLA